MSRDDARLCRFTESDDPADLELARKRRLGRAPARSGTAGWVWQPPGCMRVVVTTIRPRVGSGPACPVSQPAKERADHPNSRGFLFHMHPGCAFSAPACLPLQPHGRPVHKPRTRRQLGFRDYCGSIIPAAPREPGGRPVCPASGVRDMRQGSAPGNSPAGSPVRGCRPARPGAVAHSPRSSGGGGPPPPVRPGCRPHPAIAETEQTMMFRARPCTGGPAPRCDGGLNQIVGSLPARTRRYAAAAWSLMAARMPSHRRVRAVRASVIVSAHSAHLASSSPHRSVTICMAIGVCSSLSTWMWRAR